MEVGKLWRNRKDVRIDTKGGRVPRLYLKDVFSWDALTPILVWKN